MKWYVCAGKSKKLAVPKAEVYIKDYREVQCYELN